MGKKSTLIQCDFFSLHKQANWHQARDQEEATFSQCSADLQRDRKSTEKVIFFYKLKVNPAKPTLHQQDRADYIGSRQKSQL